MAGKFIDLNENINDILLKLLSSSNLKKLIYYTHSTPTEDIDVPDPVSTLLFQRIYPYPFSPDVQSEKQCIINVLLDGFERGKENIFFKPAKIEFIILCHSGLWKINTGLRVYSIMNEIDTLFNNQRTIGIGKTQFEYARLRWTNSDYSGYSLCYRFVDF